MITNKLLEESGAELVSYPKDTLLFQAGESPLYYFQLETGKLKMCNFNKEGKEFVQGIFKDGQSFASPPLVGDYNYPASAMTMTACKIWRLPKHKFIELLENHPKIHWKFTEWMASRLHYKAVMQAEISSNPPESRILKLIDFMKEMQNVKDTYQVPLTRQQIADMTGLRVETVIRTIKKLEENKEVQVVNHKVLR